MKTAVANVLVICTLLAAVCAPVCADQIVQMQHLPQNALTPPTWCDSAFVQQFDSSLGSLNYIRLDMVVRTYGLAAMENLSPSPVTGTVTLSTAFNLYRAHWPGLDTIASSTTSVSRTGTLAAFDGYPDMAGPDSCFWSGLMDERSTTAYPVDSDAWKGLGSVELYVEAIARNTHSAGVQAMIENYSEADVVVTYDYTPAAVPEPATCATLLSGLASFGIFGFRKRDRR